MVDQLLKVLSAGASSMSLSAPLCVAVLAFASRAYSIVSALLCLASTITLMCCYLVPCL